MPNSTQFIHEFKTFLKTIAPNTYITCHIDKYILIYTYTWCVIISDIWCFSGFLNHLWIDAVKRESWLDQKTPLCNSIFFKTKAPNTYHMSHRKLYYDLHILLVCLFDISENPQTDTVPISDIFWQKSADLSTEINKDYCDFVLFLINDLLSFWPTSPFQ